MRVFFEDRDYRAYIALLREETRRQGVDVWSYCLMPNHVHLILTPSTAESLSRAVGETHRRYAFRMNRRHHWTGHFWQERYGSCAMDEAHTLQAARYVLQNPVRACLADQAVEWPYSSAAAHLGLRDDQVVAIEPLNRYVEDWSSYLSYGFEDDAVALVRRHTRTGRPLIAELMNSGRRKK